MTKIREFATTWGSPGPRMWFEREKEELIGSARGAPEDIPNFRPFDMLAEPNQSLVVLQNQDMRIGVENVSGTQPAFRPGAVVRVHHGAVTFSLVPRNLDRPEILTPLAS